MTAFVSYDAAGMIAAVTVCPDDLFAIMPLPPGLTHLVIDAVPISMQSWLSTHYVLGGAITDRLQQTPAVSAATIPADGVTVATISGLPFPCILTVSGALQAGPVAIADGTIDITCDNPGALLITVTSDPIYVAWSTTINAT
jgi:hypothetical protein